MKKVDVVDVDVLLSDFLKRVANDEHANGQTVQNSVIKIIEDLAQNSKLRCALDVYQSSGPKEENLYQLLVILCNKILDALQEADWKDKLNVYLKENKAHPIQFVRYNTLFLKYDFPSKEPRISGKPDILIALKNAINDYPRDQSESKNPKDFDPSVPPQSGASPRILFKDVLGWVEIKWHGAPKGEAIGTPDNAPSQSSQLNNPGPREGSSEQQRLSKGSVSAQNSQTKSSSKRKGMVENNTPSQKRQRTGTDPSGDEEKAEEAGTYLLQLGHYAAEFLSRGPYATHNIGINVNHNKVQVCWFDRQNVITTGEFDICEDFPSFVAFITALSRFSLSDWGIEERFYPKGDQIRVTLQRGEALRVDMSAMPLCHRVTLHGRGTMVLSGEMTADGVTRPVAVKTSYPQVNRLSERVFVSKGDQCKYRVSLPVIYCEEEVGCPTSKIRQRLNLAPEEGTSRRRRIIVAEPLHHIGSLSGEDTIRVWLQCIFVHREMWQKGCRHGDISVYNLMYRKELRGNGTSNIVGVLNDWDLSILCDDSGSPAISGTQQLTGTIPFAALDLVGNESQPRKYRHDLESFGWSLVYICLDHVPHRHSLAPWHCYSTTLMSRKAFLSEMGEYKPRQGFENAYTLAQDFLLWIMRNVTGRLLGLKLKRQFSKNRGQFNPYSSPFVPKVTPEPKPTWEELGEEQIWEEFCSLCEEWFPSESN